MARKSGAADLKVIPTPPAPAIEQQKRRRVPPRQHGISAKAAEAWRQSDFHLVNELLGVRCWQVSPFDAVTDEPPACARGLAIWRWLGANSELRLLFLEDLAQAPNTTAGSNAPPGMT